METVKSLHYYFESELKELSCTEETKAYIAGILAQYRFADDDLSNKSITLEYSLAKFENNFQRYQRVGDYLFFANSLYPESLSGASKDYYYSLGRLSYYSCYNHLRSWKLYQEMADRFIDLSYTTRQIIQKL